MMQMTGSVALASAALQVVVVEQQQRKTGNKLALNDSTLALAVPATSSVVISVELVPALKG